MPSLFRGALVTSLLASGLGTEGSRLLADFPESLATLQWRVVNDDVMGARSQGGFRPEEQWLVCEGTTNTRGGGFSSIRSATGRFDLEGYDGVRLRVRGDGRTYTFGLTTSDTREGRFRPTWRCRPHGRGLRADRLHADAPGGDAPTLGPWSGSRSSPVLDRR